MRTIVTRGKDEGGFALPVALLMMFICLLLGLATLETVTAETHQSGYEVAGEASFNIAESVIDAESLQLQNSWPGTSTAAYATTCNQSSTPTTGCPGTGLTSSLASTYSGPSYSNISWSVLVLDDNGSGGANYYSDSLSTATPLVTYDANGDNRLWVRAQATVRGQKTIVVTQVVRTTQTVSLPQSTIVAGGVSTENNGNKIIIEATDPSSGLTGPVDVRCADSSTPSNGDPCLGWDANKGQLSPTSAYQAGYTDPDGGYATLSASQLAAMETTAQGEGSYYNGTCPTAAQINTTNVVYVENAGSCTYTTGTYNSTTSPGALIFGNGTLTFNGNVTYDGIVYMADGQGTTPTSGPCTSTYMNPVITVHGGAAVNGAIFVDKCGTIDAGEDKFDVDFNSNAFGAFKAFAVPALAKNTFRIIPNS
jgi:Tfp pilus assembly protein PilX